MSSTKPARTATPSERAQTYLPFAVGAVLALVRLGQKVHEQGWKWPDETVLASAAVLFVVPLIVGLAIRAAKLHDQMKSGEKDIRQDIGGIGTLLAGELTNLQEHNKKLADELAHHRKKLELYAYNEADLGITIDVRVSNFNNFLSYLPMYIGKEFGFFKQEKLEVNFAHKGDDSGAVTALITGESAFSITDPIFAFDVDDLHDQLRILSPFLNRLALWAVSKVELGELAKDAPLKILTYPEGTTAYHLCRGWLSHSGFTNASITAFPRSPGQSMEQYLMKMYSDNNIGQYDIMALSEPETTWLAKLKGFKHRRSLHSDLFAEHAYAFTAVLTTKDSLKTNNGEIPKRFLRAIRHSQAFINSLPPVATIKGDPEAARLWRDVVSALRANIFTCYPNRLNNDLSEQDLEGIIEEMRVSGYFPRCICYHTEKSLMDGVYRAYAAVKEMTPPNLKLDAKIVNVSRELGMPY